MEPTTMINLRVLSTAAVMALVLPMAAPTASFAQNGMVNGPNGVHITAGAAGVQPGGGGASQRMVSGPSGVRITQGAAGIQPGGGGGRQFNGGGGGRQFSGGGGGGGVYRGGYGGGYRRGGGDGGGGFIPGAVAGAVIGGAIASQGYYGQPGYYDDQSQYYDDSVAVAPEGGDDVAYCSQRFRSYDPRSGTYLGGDGYRHPCP
jgi:BA14K-like protein